MVDYDPLSEAIIEDPYPIYQMLRAESPVHYLEKYDAWALACFEDIWQASMDEQHLTATRGTSWPYLVTKSIPALENVNHMDPPAQRKLRAEIAPFFMPRRVREVEPSIREFVTECIDAFIERGEADFVGELAQLVAARVACAAFGFPEADTAYMVDLSKRFLSRDDVAEEASDAGVDAFGEMISYLEGLAAERRSYSGPIENIFDVYLRTEIEGERLDDERCGQHLIVPLIGAVETFPKVFATAILRLGQYPDQRAELLRDPRRIPRALRECLRYDMPTQFLMRSVKRDFTIRDRRLCEGQSLMFLYASGNRDEREFDDPDTFDIHRSSPRILSFGHGIHRCLGSHFAEMEGKVLLEEVLRRMPDYEVDEQNAVWERMEFIRGYKLLPVHFSRSRTGASDLPQLGKRER